MLSYISKASCQSYFLVLSNSSGLNVCCSADNSIAVNDNWSVNTDGWQIFVQRNQIFPKPKFLGRFVPWIFVKRQIFSYEADFFKWGRLFHRPIIIYQRNFPHRDRLFARLLLLKGTLFSKMQIFLTRWTFSCKVDFSE